jgi:hypothetical protein
LQKLGIPRPTFYHWYAAYRAGGPERLEDYRPRPGQIWNRIPDDVRDKVVQLALDEPTLSPRELANRFTDAERHFVSESSAYRILKAHDLITSPAFVVVKAADEFTRRPPQTSSGRPTSPISRSSAGDGIISPPSSMITRATSSPGSCVRRCASVMSPTRSSGLW